METEWWWSQSASNPSQARFPCLQGIYREIRVFLGANGDFDADIARDINVLQVISLLLLTGNCFRRIREKISKDQGSLGARTG